MKNIKWSSLFIGLICLCSCVDLTELNENPTKATSISPHLLIPTIQLTHSQYMQNTIRYFIYPGAFVNHWIGGWSMQEYGGKAKKNIAYMERLWVAYYPDIIKNAVALVSQTTDNPEEVNLNAIGRILKVEAFLKLTDYYGDIPYFEAGKIYNENIVKPRYDKQEDIYMDFLSELRAASAQLDASAMAPQNDLYFNGDIEKWRRFANSLWLRISMRLLKVNPTLAQQEAKAAYEAGVMTSNSDICYVAHESSRLDEGPGNGFANQMLEDPTYSNYRMTNELLEALTSTNDPRTLYIGGAYYTDSKRTDITSVVYEKTGSYQGVPAQDFIYNAWAPALTINIDGKDVSVAHHYQKMQPSKLLTDPASPYMHLTYAETEFYLAEAAARHWNVSSESAKEHYKKGLVAAIKQWSLFGANVPDDATLEALAEEQSSLLDAGDTEALEEINKQLWLLYILDPIEAWSNIRRSGMPSKYTKFYNLAPTENESDGKRPNRMMYPLEEQIKNKENLEEALSRMGGTDNWTSRVWWDKE